MSEERFGVKLRRALKGDIKLSNADSEASRACAALA